ncbi:MAG TPA: glycosyltransferase family 39 protein, partial [Gemmatimonadales bacterium]|nr:glycosyltransferase family 39 protein [Gemmatimonadales bacterium]
MTRRGTTAALLVALLATATALRLYHLGSWGLEGAEIFTLRDSLTTRTLRGSRPLLFFFNYHLIRPTFGLDELGIRMLPAVFGILSVPVLYWVTRAAVGARPALFACTLLTFSSLLVYRSQFARYWTLVFLLCSAYPILIYLGLRDGRWGRVALGLVVAVLAILAHPASVLLAGGLGLWMLISALGSSTLQPRVRTALRWALVAVGVIALIVAVRLLPMLESWIATPHMRRLRGPALILSHVDGLTAPVVIAAGAGIIWLARQDRSLALLLAALALVPALFLSLLSYWTAVSTVYLFPTAPVAFIGAGIF